MTYHRYGEYAESGIGGSSSWLSPPRPIEIPPINMSLRQVHLVWSTAAELYSESELNSILQHQLAAISLDPDYMPRCAHVMVESGDASPYPRAVFRAWKSAAQQHLASKISGHALCNVSKASVHINLEAWSVLSRYMLKILRDIGATESLDELRLLEDLGL